MAANAAAQNAKPAAASSKPQVGALFVSDIHFEPFWDPAKAMKLAPAPVEQWRAILAGPESPDRTAQFAAIEKACPTRGEDTAFPLYESSLQAIAKEAGDAKFATLSGDLIAHSFSCKFAAAFPGASPADYRAFVEKTIAFVLQSMRGALPGVPVYAALGNNDSDCGDYRLDANSEFLQMLAKEFAQPVPAAERARAEKDFATGGYFSATLPAPFQNTRLLVLDDLFMSQRYTTCGGKPDTAEASAQIAWLEQQLRKARDEKKKIWVMAHIPPGVDAYSTATKGKNICGGGEPTMFLSSEALPETLARYGDVVRLALFAHTHMDELRLLEPEKATTEEKGVAKVIEAGVPVKLAPSISPIDGNNPSFTVAQIDPRTSTLQDYHVFVASNRTGVGAAWDEEYEYAKAYRQADFSAVSLKSLIAEFDADPSGQGSESQSYIRGFSPGGGLRELQVFWPQYLCMLKNEAGAAFTACVCASK